MIEKLKELIRIVPAFFENYIDSPLIPKYYLDNYRVRIIHPGILELNRYDLNYNLIEYCGYIMTWEQGDDNGIEIIREHTYVNMNYVTEISHNDSILTRDNYKNLTEEDRFKYQLTSNCLYNNIEFNDMLSTLDPEISDKFFLFEILTEPETFIKVLHVVYDDLMSKKPPEK